MESQPQPSLLQGARYVHEPAAAEPGLKQRHPCSNAIGSSLHDPLVGQVDWSVNRGFLTDNTGFHDGVYFCLVARCGTTFPNPESLDLHYKLVHLTPSDDLGFEDFVPTPGQPSQPAASFHPTANLAQNGSNTIGASLHDPFMGQVDWSVNRGFLTDNPGFHDGFRTHQRLQSPYPSSFINEQQTYVVDGDHPPNAPAPLPFAPTEAASTVVGPPNPSTDPPPRHVCATCNKSFGRASDMQRHARKHNPGAQRMDCPFPGCAYTGAKGFLRSDKLRSHFQNRHQ